MASLTLQNGALTVTIQIGGTVTQVNAALRRYALAKGIPVDGRTGQEIGTDVLESLKRTIRDASIDRHRAELLAVQQAAMNTQLEQENAL